MAAAAAAPARRLPVLYGSQTGCARDVAERIAREALRRWLQPDVRALDEYPVESLPEERVVIFVVSTTGQGEAPDNMRRFWRFLLRKDLPSDSLRGLRFTVFGLGDSSYPIFNAVARRLFQRLLDLGAEVLHPRGLGDDQHPRGYDGELEPWLQGLWPAVLRELPLPPGKEAVPDSVLAPPRFEVTVLAAGDAAVAATAAKRPLPPGAFAAPLLANRRLTHAENDKDVRHMAFDIAASPLRYEPGDVALVYTQNPDDWVAAALATLQIDGETTVELRPNRAAEERARVEGQPLLFLPRAVDLPSPITLRALFRDHLDLFGMPRRHFFATLAAFATAPRERERLLEFASAEGQDDLLRYCTRERRTYVEVLCDFPSARLPLAYLLELVPRLQPRQFSIASSPLAHPGELHITMAVVRYATPTRRIKLGVCSTWLSRLEPGVRVALAVKHGSLALPVDWARRPLIMVGPGTGIAPFRAMCSHIAAAMRADPALKPVGGGVHVFFGNWRRDRDFLYADEWDELQRQGAVAAVQTAWSRASDNPDAPKVYVQHRLREAADVVWQCLGGEDGAGAGVFMVAGSAKNMPRNVQDAVASILAERGGLSEEAARSRVKDLQARRRYLVECWF
jgi:sulfite reductase alpha subunit-like flavoprotein